MPQTILARVWIPPKSRKCPFDLGKFFSKKVPQTIRAACLPIVYVPVHIVMGMPMILGMGMPMAITMGTQKTHNRKCPWLQSRARPLYFGRAHDFFHGHKRNSQFCQLLLYTIRLHPDTLRLHPEKSRYNA